MSSGGPGGEVERWLLLAVVIGGGIAIVLILLRVFGIAIPYWFETIAWVVAAVVLGCVAIKFIFRVLRS